MPGVTKYIYEHEIRDIISMWDKEILSIIPVLPQKYEKTDIIELLRYFYPHEWRSVESMYIYYKTKDRYLKKRFNRTRFNMPKPENLIERVRRYRTIIANEYKARHFACYSDAKNVESRELLWTKRKSKIERVNQKVSIALSKTQQVTPLFIDKLIGLYERKNTSQKDKMYILLELKKYYCEKIIQFFFKLNDTEINQQLRHEAFYHLQAFNFNPRLRKQQFLRIHTKNKKRKRFIKDIYSKEKYIIPLNPDELEYRIENSKDQQIKSYDYFISHSSKDSRHVQDLIIAENKEGKNVFCDWINDVDYLKRHLLCEATLNVIEYRLDQSDALIFVESTNSINSIWCKYELNYFVESGKPIFIISVDSIKEKNFLLRPMINKWFIDPNYKNTTQLIGESTIS